MTLANPGVKNLKATPGVKTTSSAGAKRYIDIDLPLKIMHG